MKPYRISKVLQEAITDEIKKLLDLGYIEENNPQRLVKSESVNFEARWKF